MLFLRMMPIGHVEPVHRTSRTALRARTESPGFVAVDRPSPGVQDGAASWSRTHSQWRRQGQITINALAYRPELAVSAVVAVEKKRLGKTKNNSPNCFCSRHVALRRRVAND